MPLRDGRSTGEEMKVSALAAGSVASGDPPALPSILPSHLHSMAGRAFKGPSGGCGPLGQYSLEGCVTLGGRWTFLC